MAEYKVYLVTTASATITVDIPDDTPKDEIIETAYDAAYDVVPELCAQCAGWKQEHDLELGEWDISTDSNGVYLAPEKV